MKNISRSVLFLLLLGTYNIIYGQTCQRIEIATNTQKKQLLNEFIEDLTKKECFVEDKGIIHLSMYKDADGRERWDLYPVIDDRYKDNPTAKYAYFEPGNSTITTVLLVWDADSTGSIIPLKGNQPTILECLSKIIEDRVYIRPPYSKRLKESTLANGKKIMIEDRAHINGSKCGYHIIFNKNGTYQKIPMA
jgi:hypothetical protein